MKKLFTILMALMVLVFTQCKPTPDGNDVDNSNTRTVKVRCEIPMNDGKRSDFTNLTDNGKINWGNDCREFVYVAIHGNNPQIIELSSHASGTPANLIFEGEAAESLITSGEEYDIWYFGHSRISSPKYEVKESEGVYTHVTGSIAVQSGKLSELGYCHIATTKVRATTDENGNAELKLNATFKNQIAILLLDLEKVDELYGDAIKGTEYSLAYNGERYELNVEYNPSAKINVVGAEAGVSYIALFPNSTENTEIRYRDGSKVNEHIMNGVIEANNFYYRTELDGQTAGNLSWSTVSSGDVVHGDGEGNKHYHHYVDLGLPSGTLWATRNVGADTLYNFGDYFAWGEVAAKDKYTLENAATITRVEWEGNVYYSPKPMFESPVSHEDSIVGISGNETYDAARKIWGAEWRMPTYDEMQELFDYCRKEPLKMPTPEGEYVNGYKFTAENGNYIFLPAAGYRDQEVYEDGAKDYYRVNEWGHYWHSTVLYYGSGLLHFDKNWTSEDYNYNASRHYGCSIRPVLAKKRYELEQDQNQNENGSDQGGEE